MESVAKGWDVQDLQNKSLFFKNQSIINKTAPCSNCQQPVMVTYLPLHEDKCYTNGQVTHRLSQDLGISWEPSHLDLGKFEPDQTYACPCCNGFNGNFCEMLTHYKTDHMLWKCFKLVQLSCMFCQQRFPIQEDSPRLQLSYCHHVCQHLVHLKSVDVQIEKFLDVVLLTFREVINFM